jgi:hypothetical protein
MEATSSSETSVGFQQARHCYIPEERHLLSSKTPFQLQLSKVTVLQWRDSALASSPFHVTQKVITL